MNGSAESHVLGHGAVTLNEGINDPQGSIDVVEVLSFAEVADHLANVVGSVAELHKFPVDNEELWLFRRLLSFWDEDTGTCYFACPNTIKDRLKKEEGDGMVSLLPRPKIAVDNTPFFSLAIA